MSTVLENLEKDYESGLISTLVYEAKKSEYREQVNSHQCSIFESKCREVVTPESEIAKLTLQDIGSTEIHFE